MEFVSGLDQTDPLVIGVACLVLILACRRFAPKSSRRVRRDGRCDSCRRSLRPDGRGVAWSSSFPQACLPSLDIPAVGGRRMLAKLRPRLLIGIAFVAFADTSVLSRSYAGPARPAASTRARSWSRMGAANAASGLFAGLPALERARLSTAGGRGRRLRRPQLTGLVGAVLRSRSSCCSPRVSSRIFPRLRSRRSSFLPSSA